MYPVEYARNGWYVIPTFSSYDINSATKEVRSHKHFNKDAFHIMKVTNGCVILTDDYGKSRRMKVDDLYEMTMFNTESFADALYERTGVYKGGMKKINRRYDSNIDILSGNYTPIEKQDKSITLDFTKIIG